MPEEPAIRVLSRSKKAPATAMDGDANEVAGNDRAPLIGLGAVGLARATFRTATQHGRRRFWFLLTTALVLFVPLGLLESIDHGIEINTDDGVDALDILAGFAIGVSALLGEVFYAGAIASVVARGPEYEPSIPELLRRIPYLTIIALDLIVAFGTAIGAVFFLLPGLWLYGSWVSPRRSPTSTTSASARPCAAATGSRRVTGRRSS